MTIEDGNSLAFGIDPRTSGESMLDFRETFHDGNPVVLEIGSGKGRFLITSAEANPSVNFIGIEKSLHYYRVIARRLEKRKLTNARIINFDAAAVVAKMIPDLSIREIHIYFPDPWPRKRERKRRIIREGVVEEFRRILEDDGFGIYVTDHAEYFEAAVPVLESVFAVERVDPKDDPRTNYEAKYREEGRPIHEVRFRKR
jgi:tRNA (guanine-N(7)-)-methyltransferase